MTSDHTAAGSSAEALEDSARRHMWLHFTRMGSFAHADMPLIARGSGTGLSGGAITPIGGLVKGWQYGAAEFLNVAEYKHVQRWADMLLERPAVRRGRMVNRVQGDPSSKLHERHDTATVPFTHLTLPTTYLV